MERVGKVGDAAQHLAPDHEAVLALAGGQQALGGVQAVDEAGAGRVQVKADGVLGKAQLLLQHAGRRGGHGVLGQGRHQADADLAGRKARAFQRLPRRSHAQAQMGLALAAVMAAPDAGAGRDPLVAGIDPFFQVEIGHFLRRQGRTGADELDATHTRSFLRALAPIMRNFLYRAAARAEPLILDRAASSLASNSSRAR